MIALIITIIVMLILVGVTVTAAINGGLFSSAKEGAKGTTIARVKEQITADIATEIAERNGEKITKSDLKQIVKQYGSLDENEENLTLKDTNYTVPLTDIWNDFDEFKLNDHGYYENCIYGTGIYKELRQYFTEEQQKELDNYLPDFETQFYIGGYVNGMTKREDVNDWTSSKELFENYGMAYLGYFKGTKLYYYGIGKAKNGEIEIANATLDYKKDTVKGVLIDREDTDSNKHPSFIENEGKEFYFTMWGS